MDGTVTVSFGPQNNASMSLDRWPTVGAVLEDTAAQSMLGFSADSVTVQVNGGVATNDTILAAGDRVTLHTKSHTKAGA